MFGQGQVMASELMRERDGTDRKFDLKQYMEITEDGLEYLRFRDELLQSSK